MATVTKHSISRRKSGWVVNVVYDDGTRRQLSCSSQAHARERLQQLLVDSAAAKPGRRNVFTIGDAWPQLVTYFERLENPASSIAQCRDVMTYFGKTKPIDEIQFTEVEEYQRHLLEKVGNSPSTVNAKVAKIRRMRELAVRAGVDALPPMPGNIPLNHINKALWTADELQAVVGDMSLRGLVKHAHLLLFLYEMGCRHSEAYRLTAKDIDLRQGTVHFFKEKPDHKNQNRRLPLTPQALDVISDYVGKDRHAGVWRFAGNRRSSLNIFEQQVRRSLERVGVHKTRPIHTLRDTCLSRLGQAGCTGFEIMQWSGHKDLKSVAIYVQMDMSRLDRMKTLLTETTSTPTVFTDSSVDLRQVVGNLQQARP